MIYNENLHLLTEVAIVKEFMRQQGFKVAPSDLDFGLVLYKLPYVVEFKDALIENYLEVYFSDLNGGFYMEGNSALGCSLDLGLQDLKVLRATDFENHPEKDIFLSEGKRKYHNLCSNLQSFEKLLPLIAAKGGLASMCDGTFNSRFDFRDSVKPMWRGMKERYLRCIAKAESSQ
jgi:hypothetical protein